MKGLKLNREKLYACIDIELPKIYQINKDSKPNNLTIIKFIITGSKPATLNIYENCNGTTTLHYKVGANQSLSQSIAEQLVNACQIKELKFNSFYIKSIRDEDFDVMLSFLNEGISTIEYDKVEQNGKRIVKIKGRQGDVITITKHSNNSFQVQGKPILLFSKVIEILSELMPFKEVIEQQLAYYETHLTTSDILGELENKLPSTHELIEDKIKAILTPSLALSKLDIELEDYSSFAFPVLRALEGVLKQCFNNNKITITKDGFGEFISKNGNNYILTDNCKKVISNITIRSKICNLYKYYNIHRHSLFHVDGLIPTTRIITKQESDVIIKKTLELIDDSKICLQ